ncbi:N-6 DNA methylase [Streptomyces sp. DHE17-7]|nr:N-6 DNA methylase [Streptomyces sp. DHE17-7]
MGRSLTPPRPGPPRPPSSWPHPPFPPARLGAAAPRRPVGTVLGFPRAQSATLRRGYRPPSSHLRRRGTAAIVLANSSHSSPRVEAEIRQAMVEADLVACMVALPPQLFRMTQIPACLWFLTKDKSPQGAKRLDDRRGTTLFIDASGMGEMVDRTERILTEADLAKIASTYHAWRGTESAQEANLVYQDEPGFCFSADVATVREHEYALAPARYVGVDLPVGVEPHAVPRSGPAALMKDLYAIFD